MSDVARRLGALTAAVAVTALAAGCGGSSGGSSAKSGTSSSSSSSSSSSGGGSDAKVAKLVPAAIRSKGTLTIASDASYAPMEFVGQDGKTVEGVDADLAKALAGLMGLKANIVNASFDGILPGLASGKYQLGMSSFGDTKEREKVVDFVTYVRAGSAFYVKAKGGPQINGLPDLCGHTVAVEKGTTEGDDVTAQSRKCTKAGKPAVKLLTYPDYNGVNLAVSSGRAQIADGDAPVAAFQVRKSNGDFKLVGKPYRSLPWGIAIPKGTGMAKPVQAGLKALMADGRYAKVLKRWGVQSIAITSPQINGATQ